VKFVAVSSESSIGAPGQANYSGSKAALNAAFQSCIHDIEWTRQMFPHVNARFNIVSPGLTNTPMVKSEIEDDAKR